MAFFRTEKEIMMDIKILVATHKKYWMPDDDIYFPIQLGASYADEIFGYQRDDQGENISERRPYYSEETALYWAWKNLKCKYLGLCQYRRYFAHSVRANNTQGKKEEILHRIDYETILRKYDMILPTKFNFGELDVEEQYRACHRIEDLQQTRTIVKNLYPGLENTFDQIMLKHEIYACNMFVMKKSMADEYCSWLFPILFELEKHSKMKAYNEYQARVCGYMAERLFNVWLATKNIEIYEANIVLLGESYWDDKKLKYRVKNFLKDKIQKIGHRG